MKRVEGEALQDILPWFEAAGVVAQGATCHRSKCGAIIVKNDVIIGRGFNAPPLNDEGRRTCDLNWDRSRKPLFDLTCCVHAEWNAVLDAVEHHAGELPDSVLYFMRVNNDGEFTDAGQPYCTTCSRFTMQAKVGEFALWNSNGADIYPLAEYDEKSFSFFAA